MSSRSSMVVRVAVSVWALLGAIDVLVWMPLALAPSTPLPRIYSAIGEMGDLLWVVSWPVLTLAAGVLAALLLTRATGRIRAASPPTRVAAVLLVVAALTFIWLWSGLPMGLWLSNHLPPYEGGMSRFGEVYGWIGTASACGGVIALALAVRGRGALRASRAARRS